MATTAPLQLFKTLSPSSPVKITLMCTRGALAGNAFAFNQDELPISIGRHPSCNISFDPKEDIRASSFHAEIRAKNSQFILSDTNSTNGTLLNEIVVQEDQTLKEGDHIMFGTGGPVLVVRFGDTPRDAWLNQHDDTTKPFPPPPLSE